MDITSQAVKLLESTHFKSYRVFSEDSQGLVDFEVLMDSEPRWIEYQRTRVNDLQINPNSICLKGESLWDDSGTQIEKGFECVITLPIGSDSQIQFL